MENSSTIVYFGPLGSRIEGRLFCQKSNTAPTVLILPPDPRYGGTFDNKIVITLEEIFQECGFSTLSINYQGSGKSDGNFTCALDGITTASVAIDWLQAHNNESSHYWVVGYSFGAYVAADLVTRRPEVENFIFISPLIKQYDFDFMCPSLCEGLVICGEKDDFIKKDDLMKLLTEMNEGLKVQVDYISIDGADHKYTGQMEQFKKEITQYVNFKIATRISKPIRKKRRKRQKKETLS